MAIKNNKNINGKDVKSLTKGSGHRVIRICDICGDERAVRYTDLVKTRNNWKNNPNFNGDNSKIDFCLPCSRKSKASNDKNVMRNKRIKEKNIQSRGQGVTYKYKDGDKYRKREKFIRNNYVFVSNKSRKRTPEHRVIMSEKIGRPLYQQEVIHHIDGNKKNNSINNLLICKDRSEHMKIHSNLESVAFDLIKRNIIKFNYIEKKYYIDYNVHFNTIPISLGFNDVTIVQKRNICNSRLDVNIESEIIRGIKRPTPFISANMSTVTDSNFAVKIYQMGGLGILHRAFKKSKDYLNEVRYVAQHCDLVAVSIGVDKDALSLCGQLINCGANIICIDIAHCFQNRVIELAKKIKKEYSNVKLIVGNTINLDMLYEVADFCDALKIGIAQGSVCQTSNTAGCTEKQFSAVLKFKEESKRFGLPIISDGSVKEPADCVKAIAAGANSIMIGSVFAKCPESAAPIVHIDGKDKKLYAGMASRYVQEQWKGQLKKGTCPEGKTIYLELGESVEKLIERYSGALKSGITYSGGKDIESFQRNVEFIRI